MSYILIPFFAVAHDVFIQLCLLVSDVVRCNKRPKLNFMASIVKKILQRPRNILFNSKKQFRF
jgi:hypothetical protein